MNHGNQWDLIYSFVCHAYMIHIEAHAIHTKPLNPIHAHIYTHIIVRANMGNVGNVGTSELIEKLIG